MVTSNGEYPVLSINSLVIIAVLLLLAGLAVWKLLRSRDKGVRSKTISVNDIGSVYRRISTQAVETSFAVFIISPPHRDTQDTLEVQFSVEQGVTGLDWILMSEPNRREKTRVIRYALDKGVEWRSCEMNDWVYLRMEQGDLVELCTSLIRDLYAVDDVLLKYGGFEYQ